MREQLTREKLQIQLDGIIAKDPKRTINEVLNCDNMPEGEGPEARYIYNVGIRRGMRLVLEFLLHETDFPESFGELIETGKA